MLALAPIELINTLMFSVTAATLRELFASKAPDLDQAFERMAAGGSGSSAARLAALYTGLSSSDFSRVVLERATESLWVLRSRACGWTDLGTPTRLAPHQLRHTAARPLEGAHRSEAPGLG